MSSWLTRGCWEALALKQFQEALPCSAFSRPCWMSNLAFSLGLFSFVSVWGNSGVWVETWSQIIEIKSDLFCVGFTFFFLHVGGTEKRGQSASDVTNTTLCVCVQTHTHTSPDIYTHTLGLTVRGCFFQGFQLNHSSLNVWEFPRIQINRLYNTRRAKFKRRNKKICKKCLTGQISKSIHFF